MSVQLTVFEPLLPLPDVTADGAWSPHIDVRELPDEFIVLADLPGVEPEAVHVTTETNTLTIEGARRDRLRAGGVPYRLERPTGKLRRSVVLPGPYDPTKIQTQIRDGVLEVRVPKDGAEAALSNSQPLREARAATRPSSARSTSRCAAVPTPATQASQEATSSASAAKTRAWNASTYHLPPTKPCAATRAVSSSCPVTKVNSNVAEHSDPRS